MLVFILIVEILGLNNLYTLPDAGQDSAKVFMFFTLETLVVFILDT